VSSAVASPPAAKDLAVRFFELLNQHDAKGTLALFDPDALIEIVPARLKGTAANEGRLFVEALLTAFPDLWVPIRSIMGTADLAVVETKMEGTQAADFLGVMNQEKHLDLDQAWMLWVARGRIARVRAYFCQNQLYRRLAVKRLDRISILG
jgi:ketosteroid isomerase-like protein